MNQQFINDLAERVLKSASLKPVGETWISFDGTIPFGGIPFLGGVYSKELYKDLYNYAKSKGRVISDGEWQKKNKEQNGNVPFYADVNGTEFRVPKITGYLKGTDSLNSAGVYIKEGIPNIYGELFLYDYPASSSDANGVFTKESKKSVGWTGTSESSRDYLKVELNAYKQNQIFGGSKHVTPETIQVVVGVYAFGTVSNVGNADVGDVFKSLNSMSERLKWIESIAKVERGWADIGMGGIDWNKFSNGTLLMSGTLLIPANQRYREVTWPVPFATTTYGFSFLPNWEPNMLVSYSYDNKSSVRFMRKVASTGSISDDVWVRFIACGIWK